MGKITTLRKLLRGDKRQLFVAVYNNIVHTGITNILSDEQYLKLTYLIRFGHKLELEKPKTFNEKLQWLKIHDHNPNYIDLVDKVEVKKIVAKIIGDDYIVPTLGVYNHFDEIDFDTLPNQFVLKCNHDSGSVVICKDKSIFDKKGARKKLLKGLKTDAYYWGREWPYKNVRRKILVEEYIADDEGFEPNDYKLMVFNGKVMCSFVCSERFSSDGLKVTFFDREWNVLPFERHYPKSEKVLKKPKNYNTMVRLAEKLAANIPFARIDFYEVEGKIYFGEITLYPGSGWEEFNPEKWDEILGDWIDLKL